MLFILMYVWIKRDFGCRTVDTEGWLCSFPLILIFLLDHMEIQSGDFSCKDPDSGYLQLCGPYGL